MKTFTLILISILMCSCESSGQITSQQPRLGDEIKLKIGESTSLTNGTVSVKFKSLAEDSRCPEGAMCIWEGNAKIILEVNRNEIALNTTLVPKTAKVNEYNIQLVDVQPYPKVGATYLPENYSITIVISKIQ